MHVLHIIANPKPAGEAASKQLAEAFFRALREKRPDATVTDVDLNANPPPFYDYATYRYFWYPVFDAAYKPTAREKAAVQYSLAQCALFNQADVLALTTPMWNFSMPAILKAWVDQVFMPNLTFRMGPGGAKPLHKIRKVVALASSGGAYEPGDPSDGLRGLMQAQFGFMGITDVEVVWAQGQNTFFFDDAAARKAKAVAEAAALGGKIAAGV